MLTNKRTIKEGDILRNFIATTETISIKSKEVGFWCPEAMHRYCSSM